MLKKFFAFGVSLIFMLNFATESFAIARDEYEIQPYYSYTQSHKTTLTISGENAICNAKLTGVSGITTQIKISMTLEKKVLFWWDEKESWTQTFNGYSGTLSKIYSGISSGEYRITTEYIVYSGTNSETITDTSAQVEV